MTSAFDPDDLGVVDELLEGLDAEDAESLRPVLSELRGLAESAPVLPNRRLSSLLAAAPQPSAPEQQPEAQHETGPATVVDLESVRSGRTASRRRRGRPATTALIIAITAGAASAGAAAVAQDGFHLWPNGGTSAVDNGPGQAPSPAGTGQTPLPARVAPAVPAPSSTTAPGDAQAPATIAPKSTLPASTVTPSAPAPAAGVPGVPQLPLNPSLSPSTVPTVPHLAPAPTPPSLLSGLLPKLP
ncbi:hypothetical protein SAT01_19320 [Sinomonas atrocyanea]|uniref:hypothetical protein n=1 Tax=Sinomonas atrocyanea TaxID=37927 RepID=UPI0011445616|nr:hypothetical protein [Sinomonas atrocyanea]GEB64484.1 hypothetical protein SAT01_19320 [Sinomonas atrocyanea]GGG64609.1 hypothetical protein GCM10007172_14960 [Sinomonas atrocyanea]